MIILSRAGICDGAQLKEGDAQQARNMRWAIYYDDGRVFTSDDGSWADAPADGVLFVLEQHGDRVNTLSGNDYYYLIDDTVAATGDAGPLLRKLGFKFGRWTSHKVYEAVSKRVAADAAKMASECLP
jgi:hypothetical protein